MIVLYGQGKDGQGNWDGIQSLYGICDTDGGRLVELNLIGGAFYLDEKRNNHGTLLILRC